MEKDAASERARARWKLLRSVVDGSHHHDDDFLDRTKSKCMEHSIHRFPGFQPMTRRIHSCEDTLTIIKNIELNFVLLASCVQPFPTKYSHEWIESVLTAQQATISSFSENKDSRYELVEYETTFPQSQLIPHDEQATTLKIRSRERLLAHGLLTKHMKLTELMSHVYNDGVDNTGNTRVWNSSLVLAYLLLHGKKPNASCAGSQHVNSLLPPCEGLYTTDANPLIGFDKILSLATVKSTEWFEKKNTLRVIELGAGMAGIPSLLLGLCGVILSTSKSNSTSHFPQIDVTITDGHNESVLNNRISTLLSIEGCFSSASNRSGHNMLPTDLPLGSKSTSIEAPDTIKIGRLLWSDSLDLQWNGRLDRHQVDEAYDLCLVSDCIHFSQYHVALIVTIGRLLRMDGVCILCQPSRGRSLQSFLTLIQTINSVRQAEAPKPLFQVHLYENYDGDIYRMHKNYSQPCHRGETSFSYDPTIHYPLLLILKKCRKYQEDLDTQTAMKYLESQNHQ